MPITTILVLSGIVSAFVIFGLTLAWGDYQTRLPRRGQDRIIEGPDYDDQDMKKAA